MPRKRDDDAQRARLSEAVFATFADRGPTGLTLRAVAERAGCTTGLVLHAFPDKRALLLHARDVLHERTKLRADAVEREATDPRAAVRAIVLGALPTDRERIDEARVWVGFLTAALADPELATRHAANSGAFSERLTRLLMASSTVSRAVAVERASALAAAVEGVSSLSAGDPDGWPPARQIAAVSVTLDVVLAG
ncbi:TetR/AcrR family transcriptional regulator [Frigoribacterium sp. 2-23]|uniref:TetR/AcrR family transcriptional regulator n=1 Tax=Frigoribacterium sp. 2-23 TaxID=3415006 RepID=UPI003C6FCFE9